jgi:mitochondrial chaperone BCS1
MTTNYIERLNKALIRPSRTDRKVKFRLADKEMITRLFCVVFKHSEGDAAYLGKLQSNALVEEDKKVERLAKVFAAKVLKLEFSPAEILLCLLEHKQSPREAVDNVEAWITRIMEDRKKVKNKETRFVSSC